MLQSYMCSLYLAPSFIQRIGTSVAVGSNSTMTGRTLQHVRVRPRAAAAPVCIGIGIVTLLLLLICVTTNSWTMVEGRVQQQQHSPSRAYMSAAARLAAAASQDSPHAHAHPHSHIPSPSSSQPSLGFHPLGRRYTVVASLEDGPSEMEKRTRQQQQQQRARRNEWHGESGNEWLAAFESMHGHGKGQYTDEQLKQRREAAMAAHKQALAYVQRMHQSRGAQQKMNGKGGKTAKQSDPSPPVHLSRSGFDHLVGRALNNDVAKKNPKRQQRTKSRTDSTPDGAYHFAESDVFLEDGVKMKTETPFPPQDWTYQDSASPPAWMDASPNAPQGCPTTKPPPVPMMPPPPPPTPSPAWMSPFEEPKNEVFPHTHTPSPFYGMGPPPPSPPDNYLPLDTFLSPAPEGQ